MHAQNLRFMELQIKVVEQIHLIDQLQNQNQKVEVLNVSY